jgi:hypothetical protein
MRLSLTFCLSLAFGHRTTSRILKHTNTQITPPDDIRSKTLSPLSSPIMKSFYISVKKKRSTQALMAPSGNDLSHLA